MSLSPNIKKLIVALIIAIAGSVLGIKLSYESDVKPSQIEVHIEK